MKNKHITTQILLACVSHLPKEKKTPVEEKNDAQGRDTDLMAQWKQKIQSHRKTPADKKAA